MTVSWQHHWLLCAGVILVSAAGTPNRVFEWIGALFFMAAAMCEDSLSVIGLDVVRGTIPEQKIDGGMYVAGVFVTVATRPGLRANRCFGFSAVTRRWWVWGMML